MFKMAVSTLASELLIFLPPNLVWLPCAPCQKAGLLFQGQGHSYGSQSNILCTSKWTSKSLQQVKLGVLVYCYFVLAITRPGANKVNILLSIIVHIQSHIVCGFFFFGWVGGGGGGHVIIGWFG